MLTSCDSRCSSSSIKLWTKKSFCYFHIFFFSCRIKHITNPQGKGKYKKEGMCSQIPAFYLFIEQMVPRQTWAYVDCFTGEGKCAFKEAWLEMDWCHCNLFSIQPKFWCSELRSICCVTEAKKVQKRSRAVNKLHKQMGNFHVWIRETFLKGHGSSHGENTSAKHMSISLIGHCIVCCVCWVAATEIFCKNFCNLSQASLKGS